MFWIKKDGGAAPGFAGERAGPPHRLTAAAESAVRGRGKARDAGDDGDGGGGGGTARVTE